MDPCTAPVRSLAVGQIAMQSHLFVGTADGNLVYYLITKSESRPGSNQDKKTNVDDLGPLNLEEDLMGTCNSMLMTKNQHFGHRCKDSLQKATLFQKDEHLNMPQLTLTHGRVIKKSPPQTTKRLDPKKPLQMEADSAHANALEAKLTKVEWTLQTWKFVPPLCSHFSSKKP